MCKQRSWECPIPDCGRKKCYAICAMITKRENICELSTRTDISNESKTLNGNFLVLLSIITTNIHNKRRNRVGCWENCRKTVYAKLNMKIHLKKLFYSLLFVNERMMQIIIDSRCFQVNLKTFFKFANWFRLQSWDKLNSFVDTFVLKSVGSWLTSYAISSKKKSNKTS